MQDAKRTKHFIRDKRGLSSTIGALFIILMIMLGFSTWQWQISETQGYQDVLAEMNSLDQDRLSEDLEFKYPGITEISGTGPYTFNISVHNTGPIDLEVVRIYLDDKTNSSLTILDHKTDDSAYGFEDGYVKAAKKEHKIAVVSPVEPDDDNEYELRLVTARGRIFSTPYPMPTTEAIEIVELTPIQMVYSHFSMKCKREGVFDWKPPNVTRTDVTSGQLYLRAIFGNMGNSTITMSTDSVVLGQISKSGANQKDYFLGGQLMDPATKGWLGSLTIEPGSTEYLYFKIVDWNIPPDPPGGIYVFTGSAALVGTMDGEFWSGAMLMDGIRVDCNDY